MSLVLELGDGPFVADRRVPVEGGEKGLGVSGLFDGNGVSGVVGGHSYPVLRWGFRLAELGLIASVLFHAINGIRIVLFDFWPRGARYHRELFQAVVVVFFAIMIPVAAWVVWPLFSAPR